MNKPEDSSSRNTNLVRQLGLFDSTMILMGIVIGSGIFLMTGIIAKSLPSGGMLLLAWVVGGGITLTGALVYAELGAAMPEAGGQYVYLREAYGSFVAFLSGWVIFLVYMCGGIALLGVAFSEYFGSFFPLLSNTTYLISTDIFSVSNGQVVAVVLIILFSLANYIGVVFGKMVQNTLTVIKIGAILLLIIFGLLVDKGVPIDLSFDASGISFSQLVVGFGVAMVAVFWAFDGWNNVNFVAGEIKNPARNLPLTLILGTALVGLIYVMVNVVYLKALPISEMAGVVTIADSASSVLFGTTATMFLTVAILISIAGALNGSVLVGARVYYAMAKDGLFFKKMATVHPRFKTPSVAIVTQAVWSSVLALSGTIEQLFIYIIFSAVIFWIITVAGVFILRKKQPDLPRPYKTWGYPVTPIIFIIACMGILINTLFVSPLESLVGLGITAIGIPVYFYWRRKHGLGDTRTDKSN
jgi:APA family basic amino acid/polyamine antiporter